MHFRGRQRQVGAAVVIELDGDADLASLPQLAQSLARGVDRAEQSVIVDLDALTVLDDAALGLLVGSCATARRNGVSFALLATNDRVRERLSATRLDEIIDIVDRLPIPNSNDPA